jgi:hypothetical protein
MHHKTLLASALAVLLAGSASLVLAQNAPPQPPATREAPAHDMRAPMTHHRDSDHQRMRHGNFERMHSPVIGDLRELERLYIRAGRSKDLAALYREVLAKSQNPRVRDYVYRHLARLQAQPANFNQAIATLHTSLDENLAREAKMAVAREKMREVWQKRHGQEETPPTR